MFNDRGTPHREFQKGLDAEERRRGREDERLRLRKKERQQILKKRRTALRGPGADAEGGGDQIYTEGGDADTELHNMDKLAVEMLGQLNEFVKGCFMDHRQTNYECCVRIRKLLSIQKNPPIKRVIDSGVVPRLIQFCRESGWDKLQFEAAWALTNIASGKAEHTAELIRKGAIPVFVFLLRTAQAPEVFEQAVWALGNIAGDSPECRDLVLKEGALQALVPRVREISNLSDRRTVQVLRNVCWTLSNFCRGKPPPELEHVQDAVPMLRDMLNVPDAEVLQDAAWGFSYLSDSDFADPDGANTEQCRMQLIINSGSLPKLVQLLAHPSPHVQHPAVRTIGNACTGNEKQTQLVLNLGMLKKLAPLLSSEKPSIRKEACWTISNVTAGNSDQIEQVIDANLVQSLVHLNNSERYLIQKEATWALSNATMNGNPRQIRFLVNQGAVPGLVKILKCHNQPTILVALEGLSNILRLGHKERHFNEGVNTCARVVEEANGVEILEQLQGRDVSDRIIDKAAELMRDYFGGHYTMDPEDTEQQTLSGEQFGFSGQDPQIKEFLNF